MMAWIRSTSGRMALRVRNIGLGLLLQNRKVLAGFLDRMLDPRGRRSPGHVMLSQYGLDREGSKDVLIERRAERAKLGEREVRQLAAAIHAFLHRVSDDLMGLTEAHA